MNVVSALISVNCLEVCDVPDDVVLVDDAITAKHVSRVSCDRQSLTTVVVLHHADHFRGELVSIFQLRYPMNAM